MIRGGVDLLRIAARVACPQDGPCAKAPEGLTREGMAQGLRDRMEGLERTIAQLQRQIASMLKDCAGMAEEEWKEMMAGLIASIRSCRRRHQECEVLLRRVLREPWDERLLKLEIP